MIQVLKNADFSSCGLGKIKISDYSDESKAAFLKFDNLSQANKIKVGTLIDTLVDEGIYSKLHYLMLPLIASSVTEGVQNVLSDVTPSTINNLIVVNGGIKATEEGVINLTSYINGTPDYDDFTLLVGTTSDSNALFKTARIATLKSSIDSNSSRVYEDRAKTDRFCYKGYGSAHDYTLDSIVLVSHDSTNSVEKYYNGESITSASDTGTCTNNGLSLSSTYAQETDAYHAYYSGTYHIVVFADLLTDSQMISLYNAVSEFLG